MSAERSTALIYVQKIDFQSDMTFDGISEAKDYLLEALNKNGYSFKVASTKLSADKTRAVHVTLRCCLEGRPKSVSVVPVEKQRNRNSCKVSCSYLWPY